MPDRRAHNLAEPDVEKSESACRLEERHTVMCPLILVVLGSRHCIAL